jgi:hypothetical protein
MTREEIDKYSNRREEREARQLTGNEEAKHKAVISVLYCKPSTE